MGVDTSRWPRAYTILNALLNERYDDHTIPQPLLGSIRSILIHNVNERFYSWMIAALLPWSATVNNQIVKASSKKHPPRPTTVVRDSLRCDNKVMNALTTAAIYHRQISDAKTAFLKEECGSLSDTRWKLGELIRNMGAGWRLCVVQSILMEIMGGESPETGKQRSLPLLNPFSTLTRNTI